MTQHRYTTVETSDGTFDAYVARPAHSPAAAVVVVQEIFGVNADLRDTCDGLARHGFLAFSPDLFWRMERGVDMSDQTPEEWKRGFALYSAFDYDAGVADIAATMAMARTAPTATGKVGLMGYCLGGLMAFITTARKGADASVVYYGGRTEEYLDEAAHVRSPIMVHLGEEDEYIPREAQQAIAQSLASNPLAEVYTYPGQSHAFARHRGKHYDREAAALANQRTLDFLDRHLR